MGVIHLLIFENSYLNPPRQVAALKGYENANSTALGTWEKVYANDTALIALTDTFSTEAFFQVSKFIS